MDLYAALSTTICWDRRCIINSKLPSFKNSNGLFDVNKLKSKDYYSLLIKEKVCLPKYAQKLKNNFILSNEELKQIFLLLHFVAFEPYVKAFQFKVLNSILYTNLKMFKIGYKINDLCSFCNQETETVKHFFWICPYSISFWKSFEQCYWFLRREQIHLTYKDILIGILSPKSPLLNYLLLIQL